MTPLRQFLFDSKLNPKDIKDDLLLLVAQMTAISIIENGEDYDQIVHTINSSEGTATVDIALSNEFIEAIRLRILTLDTHAYPKQ